MCNFRVGQKVVAIRTEGQSEYEQRMAKNALDAGVKFPEYDTVYTIRSIFTSNRLDGTEIVSLHLNEIRNPEDMKFNNGRVGEIGFYARCFRPVIDKKTDISIFKAMLNPSKQGVTA